LKSLKGREDASFALATESAMTKVFLEGGRFESEFAKQHRLSAARNERESFQVIVFPLSDDVADVTWEIEPPRNATGDEVGASARVVGYVDCMQPSYPVDHNGWWPDPLLEYADSIDEVPFGEVLPLWVSIDVPADAKPGTYRGKVTVNAGGESQSVAIRLRVWDFELPNNTHLRTALSLRGFREGIWPGLGPEETRSGYEDWMQGYYLNPGDIYSGPPKWSAERIRELVDGGMNAINLGYFGAAREPDFDEAAYWRSYEALAAKIEDYMPTIEEAGARDLCYIYCFDERPQDQLDVVFETANKLSERFPGIAIMTTAYDANFGLSRDDADAMDIWVPLTPKFDTLAPRIADARAAGRDIWWYICIGPKHPHANWFIEYPAIEHRLIMGMMTAKYEPGGFLYYAVNRWPVNPTPCAGAPRTDWNPASYRNNNGDGSIMVAGPDGPMATLRLENIRDGIEDYEYYLLLRELIDERGAPEALGEVTKDVVADLTHFTYDPDVLSKERERVAREILALRRR
ncbi:MAG TPA: DUF6067 family protein, partial [Armatimonadota bacterium]|nr:DUF6067 family protein [Armatimonadota bacterium]